jgi:dienelactone hydrolase
MRSILAALMLFGFVAAQAAVTGNTVTYVANGDTLKGYIAYDDKTTDPRPGILVVHEWWGNNDYSRHRADMLAQLGYIAFALDMFGNGKQASNPDDAKKFVMDVTGKPGLMESRFRAALEQLRQNKLVDASRLGAIGYCFGGGVVLGMARRGLPLNAVVSFHGGLASPKPVDKGAVKGSLLVCNGAADTFVSAEEIKNFKSEMTNAGVKFTFIDYPDAVHAFTNPNATELGKKFNLGIAYNEKADKKSWEDMKNFFTKIFTKK